MPYQWLSCWHYVLSSLSICPVHCLCVHLWHAINSSIYHTQWIHPFIMNVFLFSKWPTPNISVTLNLDHFHVIRIRLANHLIISHFNYQGILIYTFFESGPKSISHSSSSFLYPFGVILWYVIMHTPRQSMK